MIEVEHLSKIYGSTAAIEDVTFSVPSGEILGFLGPNGAGKTTTMRILSGYLPATQGTATIDGIEVHENSMAIRQKIGYLPETPPLYRDMTVEAFLKFVAEIKAVPRSRRTTAVQSALERCNLLDKRHVLIQKLSKGFRQRVGIAQAIVHDPPVIILDEPTVGLDPKQIIDIRNLIKSLAGDHTVILSTHILSEVSMTCSQVAIINKGKIVTTGKPETLIQDFAGQSSYELEVSGDYEQIQTALSQIPAVQSVEMISQIDANRIRIRVLTHSTVDIADELVKTVVMQGFKMHEIRRQQASLEEVFLGLTEAEKRQEAIVLSSIAPGTEIPSEILMAIEPRVRGEES
jgi:ABC-2 type transport system ATP-binding protein